MNEDRLRKILAAHRLWLKYRLTGERADLNGADLSDADLSGANLRYADLNGADLSDANLLISLNRISRGRKTAILLIKLLIQRITRLLHGRFGKVQCSKKT